MNRLGLKIISTVIMATVVGCAGATVKINVDTTTIATQGGAYSYSLNLYDKNDNVKTANESFGDINQQVIIAAMKQYDLPKINQYLSAYTDSFTFGSSASSFDMTFPVNDTEGNKINLHCHLNAQQLKSASMANQTITFPANQYCQWVK